MSASFGGSTLADGTEDCVGSATRGDRTGGGVFRQSISVSLPAAASGLVSLVAASWPGLQTEPLPDALLQAARASVSVREMKAWATRFIPSVASSGWDS